jgi:DNA replication protein DnaC
MIKEFKITGWNNDILDNGNVKYPQSNDPNAPKNYFLVGARGSGKTFLLSKL